MRHALAPILAALVLAGCAAAPGKTVVIPRGIDRAYDEYHYAPAVRVGDTVIVSGIPAGIGADYETKVRNMFKNLKGTLAAAGATLDDVVEINTYHRDPKNAEEFDAEFQRFLAIHKEYFPHGYPAWTAVGTTALLAPGAVLEMRVVAVAGAGRNLKIERKSAAAKP